MGYDFACEDVFNTRFRCLRIGTMNVTDEDSIEESIMRDLFETELQQVLNLLTRDTYCAQAFEQFP